MSHILKVENLSKQYEGKTSHLAVDQISFSLNKGEILGLLGPNGAGKTTTLQMLMSTLKPTGGKIVYFGKDLKTHRSEILKKVTFASTYVSLPWNLTIEQNLNVFGRLFSLRPKTLRKRRDELLDRFGILNKLKAEVSELSSGQITRLMLVKAFFIEPKIVLLDEPTASLDPDIAKEVVAFVLEQREKKGVSILFTSHNMLEVSEVCDRILFLKNGKIFADDLPQNLAKKAASSKVTLIFPKGCQEAIAIAKEQSLVYEADHRKLVLELSEEKIAQFLMKLASKEILYSGIEVAPPTLEDFFLQASRGKR